MRSAAVAALSSISGVTAAADLLTARTEANRAFFAAEADTIARLRSQYADLAKNDADLSSRYGAQHPQVTLGGMLDPHAAYLILRGLKTYFVRYQAQFPTTIATGTLMTLSAFTSGK